MKKILITLAAFLQLGYTYAQLEVDSNQLLMDSINEYSGTNIEVNNSNIEANVYPIRYHDGLDVFIELQNNDNGVIVEYMDKETTESNEQYLPADQLNSTISNLGLSKDYSFWFHEVLEDESMAYQSEPLLVSSQFTDVIVLSLDLYQQMAYWTKNQKEMTMRDQLFYLHETGVAEEVLVSYTQQFFHETNFSLSRSSSFEGKIDYLFDNSKRDEDFLNGWCDCAYLTHNAIFAPGEYDGTTGVNSPYIDMYYSHSPDFHYTNTVVEGPAHYKGLFMRDKNGGMSYETSTLGVSGNGASMSPSFVKQAYNLVCIGNWETPTCKCTKIIGIDKTYATRLTAYAPDKNFFWSDGSQAAVQEFAALIVNNEEYGTRVLDAGTAKVRDACETTWNPEWFDNLFALAGDVLGVAISLSSDTSSLDSLNTFADNIQQVGNSIVTLASTPFVNETGTCTPVIESATLLSGKQFWILKSNQPTDIIMASYTYLGSRGYGSWDTKAVSESGYSLSTVLQSRNGFRQGVNDCCTDRVGHWNAASITNNPLSESNYINLSASHLGLYGPWNNINYDVYGNPIFSGNGGYFVYDDLEMKNCAETVPDWEKAENIPFENNSDITDFEFSLAPNPTNDFLNISILSNNITNLDVSVYSMSGEKLETVYYGITQGLHQLQWDCKNLELASSNYFIIVADDEGNKEVKQFVYKND